MDPNQQNTPEPPAPSPVVEQPPTAPPAAPAEPPTVAPQLPPSPESKKSLIVGLVAGIGGLVIIGVAVFIILLNTVNKQTLSTEIKTLADLKAAITDKKPINCEIASKDQGSLTSYKYTVVADDGWNKVKMVIGYSLTQSGNFLVIKDDATYIWGYNGDEAIAYKVPYGQKMSVFGGTDELITGQKLSDMLSPLLVGESEEGVKFSCQNTIKPSDFDAPKDIDFKEPPSASDDDKKRDVGDVISAVTIYTANNNSMPPIGQAYDDGTIYE